MSYLAIMTPSGANGARVGVEEAEDGVDVLIRRCLSDNNRPSFKAISETVEDSRKRLGNDASGRQMMETMWSLSIAWRAPSTVRVGPQYAVLISPTCGRKGRPWGRREPRRLVERNSA